MPCQAGVPYPPGRGDYSAIGVKGNDPFVEMPRFELGSRDVRRAVFNLCQFQSSPKGSRLSPYPVIHPNIDIITGSRRVYVASSDKYKWTVQDLNPY